MKTPDTLALRMTAFAAAALILCVGALTPAGTAQEGAPATQPSDTSVRELDSQVRELRAVIEQMRTENAESRAEMRELRQELQDTRKMLAPIVASSNASPAPVSEAAPSEIIAQGAAPAADLGSRVQRLEESAQLLGSKIDEQYQTKVETAGRYRARLTGIVLMNTFHNVGASDNLDVPDYAEPAVPGSSQSSFGATLRQTEIGLEIFGPNVAGARTSGDVQFDFFGGFPATENGVDFGVARMRTAALRLDWKNTSLVAGQDSLFISPLSPTSFASLATPTFAYAGNLWAWTPQIRVEHRFDLDDQQRLMVQGGILDNLDWETPTNSFTRTATAGESTGQPAYAVRTAWSRPVLDHPLSFGVAGYYGRQQWSWDHNVDAWAGMTDWQIPLLRRLNLSGEFYRGRGVGGLGAAVGQTIVFGGNPSRAATPIRGLNSAGGWSQLKFQITPKLEMNGVVAEDDAFASDIRGFAIDANNFGEILGRNRGAFGNLIYRPRSDLLLAAEFRRLHTFPIYDAASLTNQVNLSVGILF